MSACFALLPACSTPEPELTDKISQKPVWEKKIQGVYCLEYVENSLTYVTGDKVTAADPATGKTRWTSEDLGSSSSCPLYTPRGVYYMDGKDTFASLDPRSGKQAWKTELEQSFSTYASSAPKNSDTALHVDMAGHLLAVDPVKHKEIWRRSEAEDMWVEQITASGDMVITTTPNGRVRALSAADGKVKWTYKTPSSGLIEEPPVVLDGSVYFGSYDAYVYSLSAGTGKLQWRTKIEWPTGWAALIAKDVLFIPDGYYMYGLDIASGKILWRKDPADYSSTYGNGSQFFYKAPLGRRIYSIDPRTGDEIWQLDIEEEIKYCEMSDDMLFVVTSEHVKAFKIK
jgi:outer membrane protein assembly factor BamB